MTHPGLVRWTADGGDVSASTALGDNPALESVLDAIERSIDRGELFVWPTVETRIAQIVRRLAPGVLWKRMDEITARVMGALKG